MKFRSLTALLALSAVLSACVSGTDSTPADPNPTAGFQAQFNPDFGILPFPNDLYSGSSGQLAIPGDAKVAANGPLLALNHLDGYGTQSDISVYFTSTIDKNSITKDDVIVLKVTSDPTNKAVVPTSPATILTFGTDYTATVSPASDVNGTVLTIKPVKPLAPSTVDPTTHVPTFSTYMVVITGGLKDTSGAPATQSDVFSKVITADAPLLAGKKYVPTGDATFDAVAQFTAPQLALIASGLKIPLQDVAVSFSFSTQFLGIALAGLDAGATAVTQPTGTGEMVDTGEDICTVLVNAKQVKTAAACPPGATHADLFVGGVTLPYYLTAPSKNDPTAALTDSWHNSKGGDIALNATDPTSFVPVVTSSQNIPIIASIPNTASGCTKPGSGWPVVIFQHGITRNREDMLGIAGTFAQECFAVVAIDLPLHGVTDKTDPLYQNQLFARTAAATILTVPVTERTFDMDLENNSTGAAGADGTIDASGAWFINLASTITSRDNLRQGAADLINLTVTLPTIVGVTPPATVNNFDPANIYFLGHSLGGIVGTTFLGADAAGATLTSTLPRIKAATLAMPGGHIAELLRNSTEFEPIIDNGLQQQGLVKGTQAYYDFYSQAQAVVEDGDPANYAFAANAAHPIHMIEVVGDGAKNLPDQVVPNVATQVLIDVMGLTKVTATTIVPTGIHGVVQFTAGDHGSILDPTSSAAATTEMQTEALIFAAGFPVGPIPGGGEAIVINDNSVVKH